MSSDFNPIGRKCVIYSENSYDGNIIEFHGKAVGFLGEYLGVEGVYSGKEQDITIEWFPSNWILKGRISRSFRQWLQIQKIVLSLSSALSVLCKEP